MTNIRQVLEQRTARSAQMLRNLLGPIHLEVVTPDIGRPFYRAVHALDALLSPQNRPPLVRRAVRILCKGGRGRKEFEPRQQSRSTRSSSTGLRCLST